MDRRAARRAFVVLTAALWLGAPLPVRARSMPVHKKPPKPAFIYATWQSFGAAGAYRVRLLEDSRVTRAGANRHGTVFFSEPNLLPARLEVVDTSGKVLDARVLDRPIADMQRWQLGDGHETFAVTVDYTCGAGSYCGPITLLYRAVDGHLDEVESFDRTLGKTKTLVLIQSLKTGWRRERSADGRGWDIIAVACRPQLGPIDIFEELERGNDPKVEFITAYVRHEFRDGKWTTDWTQRKRYTDVLSDADIERLPESRGRDPYRDNQGLMAAPRSPFTKAARRGRWRGIRL